jgi:hypothetical protein
MALSEEVRNLQQQGLSDEQIIQSMRDRNVSYREIADALAQSRIKAAVEDSPQDPNAYSAPSPSGEFAGTHSIEGMQPSIMTAPNMGRPELAAPSPSQNYPDAPAQQEYNTPYADPYSQYQQPMMPSTGASPDMISEIADQIMTEKLGDIRKHLEKIIDMKTTFDSKVEYIDERLKKIEKVIDTLQTSVLRKVGDYVTNVADLKSELIETQKTFNKLLPSRNKPQNQQNQQNKPHSGKHHPHDHKR